MLKLRSEQKISISDLDIDTQLIDKINKFAPIKHILKNKIQTKIASCKTIREANGVVCSSRNFNLNKNNL